MGNKIVWLVSGPRSRASSRIQAYNIHEKLVELGYNSYVLFEPGIKIKRAPLRRKDINSSWLRSGDVVVIQKFESKKTLDVIKKFRCLGVKVVYIDCDLPPKIEVAQNSDLVITPSKKYQEIYSGFEGVNAVFIPDCPEKYTAPQLETKKGNVCVWFGSSFGNKWLEVEFFEKLLEKYQDLAAHWQFKTVSDSPLADIKWNDSAFDEIAKADLVVIPIPNMTEDYEVKSANRLLQAMALGVPVLASPLDAYMRVADQNNLDRVICSDETDWLSRLRYFMELGNLNTAAKDEYAVALKYSLDNVINEWINEIGIGDNFKTEHKQASPIMSSVKLNMMEFTRGKYKPEKHLLGFLSRLRFYKISISLALRKIRNKK